MVRRKVVESIATEKRRAGEWTGGWPVVAAGITGMVMMSMHTGPIGVLMKPLGDEFGWSRSEISASLMIITIIQFLFAPLVGVLIPRFGIRPIALLGTILYSAGFAALGFCNANIWSWYLGWGLLGFGMTGICALVWTTAITRAFVLHRGLALSVALSGTGIATFLTPLITAVALENFGWRAAFFILAGLGLFVILPSLGLLMRGRLEFGAYDKRERTETKENRSPFRELLRDARVWKLIAASILIAASVGTVITHMQAIMRDAGATATQAAIYFSFIGPALIAGRIASGFLLDNLPTRLVAASLFLLPGITCLMLIFYTGSTATGIIVCILFGLGYGAETDVLAYLTARYFGRDRYPLVYSIVFGVFGVSYGTAAVLGGKAFDHFGSYHTILYAMFVLVVLGVLTVLALGPEPRDEPLMN